MSGKVKIRYHCNVCKSTHELEVPGDLAENQPRVPFPYAYLHGEARDILTILYLDAQLKVRGVEVKQLGDEDIFSKEQVVQITRKLTDEISKLQAELAELNAKYEALKKEKGV